MKQIQSKQINKRSKLFQEIMEYMIEVKEIGNMQCLDLSTIKLIANHNWVKFFKEEDGLIYVQTEKTGYEVKYEIDEDECCEDCGHLPLTGTCFYCKQD